MNKDWPLPTVVDPTETVCITVEIPKDDAYIRAFFGALDDLERPHNWKWDGLKTGLAVAKVWRRQIAIAAQELRTGNSCMVDCAEVEVCLDTSTIINIIEGDIIINSGDIVNNTNDIVNNTTNVTEIINNPPDGNVYADAPLIETDPACGAAYYIVAQVRAFIVDAENWTTAYTDETDTLENIIGVLNFMWSPLYALLAYLFDPSPPASVLTDYDAQGDDMRSQLYCEGFDKTTFSDYVRTLTNGTAIADFIDCIALSQWQEWYSIGQSDLSQDCSSFFCVEWCVDIKPGDANVTFVMVQPGMYYDANGWHGNNPSQNDFCRLAVQMDSLSYTQIKIEIDFTSNGDRQYQQTNGYEFQLRNGYNADEEYPAGLQTHTINSTVSSSFHIFVGDYGTIHSIRVYGTGTHPFTSAVC